MKRSKLAPVVCACLAAFSVAHCGDDAGTTPGAGGGGNNCEGGGGMVPGPWRPPAPRVRASVRKGLDRIATGSCNAIDLS